MANVMLHRDVTDSAPWYRQFWPWFLIALPGGAVVAGIATLLIAMHDSDGLVADDYYREGLAINKVIDRDRKAQALGLSGQLTLVGSHELRVVLGGDSGGYKSLKLRFLHPTRAHRDASVVLKSTGEAGVFGGDRPRLAPGNYYVMLECEEGGWRLIGRLLEPGGNSTPLAPGNT